MLTDLFVWIIPAVVALVVYAKVFVDMQKETNNFWCKFGVSSLIATLASTLTVIVSAIMVYGLILTNFIPKTTTVYFQEIVSLRDNSQISGSFILGTGNIGTTNYYIFYQRLKDGGLRKRQIRDTYITIYENNNEVPRYEWTEEKLDFSKTKLYKPSRFNKLIYLKQYNEKLYVPEGTIIQQFRLE